MPAEGVWGSTLVAQAALDISGRAVVLSRVSCTQHVPAQAQLLAAVHSSDIYVQYRIPMISIHLYNKFIVPIISLYHIKLGPAGELWGRLAKGEHIPMTMQLEPLDDPLFDDPASKSKGLQALDGALVIQSTSHATQCLVLCMLANNASSCVACQVHPHDYWKNCHHVCDHGLHDCDQMTKYCKHAQRGFIISLAH